MEKNFNLEIINIKSECESLVNVPVRVNIWHRCKAQKLQFDVLAEAKPSVLILKSDGGRNESEWERIEINRKLFEKINWNCKIFKVYFNKNVGLYKSSQICNEIIWKNFDRCIFLEDDQIPSLSYFSFCSNLLEKFKYDERIECICGFNHLGKLDINESYCFSRQGGIWGTATWRRCYDNIDTDIFLNTKNFRFLKKADKRFIKLLKGYAKNKQFEGHPIGGEFRHEYNCFVKHRLQIIPKYNLIKNVGYGDESEHFSDYCLLPRSLRRLFDLQTFEIEKEIVHPKIFEPNIAYEKTRNRILGFNHPLIRFFRHIEVFILSLWYGKFFKKIKLHFKNKNRIEN